MAGIIGQFGQRWERGEVNPWLGGEINELSEVISEFDAYEMRRALQGARSPFRLAQSNRWMTLGQRKTTSFFDDFYNRIYFIPGALDAGNLLSTQTRTVTMWNAYLVPQTLEAAELGPQAGISLSLPVGVSLPYEVEPLREISFSVQIDVSGPPTIDSYADFTVEGVTYRVPIIGRRIVLFPFEPTWGSPVDETITMRSWVLPAENGDEQTGSESGEVPRRSLEFNINLRSAVEAQRCENLLFSWQSRLFGVPHWGEVSYLDSDIAEGATILPFDTFGLSFEPGSLVALYYDNQVNEIREVEAVSAGGVTLTTGVGRDWPEGTRVYPCFVGLAGSSMTGTRETTKYGRMPVMFDFEPSVTPGNTDMNDAPLEYRDKELFLGSINWQSAMPFSFVSDSKRVDMNTGKFYSFSSSGFSKFTRRHNWTMYDRADIFDFRKFVARRQGVARSVFMPSGMHDFTMAAPILAVESILVVESNDYATLVGAHPARRDIIIELIDGTYFCRRVETADTFDAFTRLHLDSPLGQDVSPSDVLKISFLTLYRFESPSTTIRYLTNSKATVESNMVAKMTED